MEIPWKSMKINGGAVPIEAAQTLPNARLGTFSASDLQRPNPMNSQASGRGARRRAPAATVVGDPLRGEV